MSSLLFTPTDTATYNLASEGISGDKVRQVGDVMYDAALYYRNKAQRPSEVQHDGAFILSTIHRAENTDNPERLSNIIRALNEIAVETPVILPLHPRTRKLFAQGKYDTRNIILLEPVGYLQMVWLLEHCKLVVTDSGGLQKEAYFFGKPCVTTRCETEWVELVESGWNILVGYQQALLLQAVDTMSLMQGQQPRLFYGNGNSGVQIIQNMK